MECTKCHYKKATTQAELDSHFNKIHAKSVKGDNNRQAFLLTFFKYPDGDPVDHYEEIVVNRFWLVKSYNSENKKWQVAIYTQQAFERYKMFKRG